MVCRQMFDVKKKLASLVNRKKTPEQEITNILTKLKSANEKYILESEKAEAGANNKKKLKKVSDKYVKIQMQAESILEKYEYIQNKDVENIKKIIKKNTKPWAETLEKANYQGVALRF